MSDELSFPSSDASSPPTRPTVQTDSGLRPYAHKKQQFMTSWKWTTVVSGVWCVGVWVCERLRMAPSSLHTLMLG